MIDGAVSEQLPGLLRQALGVHWEFSLNGDFLEIQHPHRGSPYCPPRRPPSWAELLGALKEGFAAQGIKRDACLPLRWGRETELTISAVQALDPLLKEGRLETYRRGFIPQPVVRFTGQRTASGELCDGFLTSFVNVSCVQPVGSIDEYGAILDAWLSVLSQLGFHVRHISIYGRLAVWQRRQVKGITLRFRHLDLTLGDIVLLWNAENPLRMGVDLGTSLERLAWARTLRSWHELIFGPLAGAAPPSALDAIRTATLLLGHGITPSARSAGGVTRRVLGTLTPESVRLGVSAAVRSSHQYWTTVTALAVPWPTVASIVETEVNRR
ncbi:hypothetical protein GCM10012285_21190 [Streptomyces kronopolitis]|uniref:Uncharacterized protein n=1 Tax=Streptomyces kronopolitis TaxID=1612435 RepID=A0ABQ2JBI1_9ACTN|nr:hypothetical protein GCM10012285_21190 [Streptomyces kronopolitis]